MKIGIMVSSQSPQIGGGFTFEEDILASFLRLHARSPHQFFLVGYPAVAPEALASTGLTWLTLHRPRAERWREKWRKLGLRIAGKKARHASPQPDYERYPALRTAPPDLIIYLTPLVRPVADIPYVTVVWDLMHRITPFFPEVARGGEWESRERRYREILPRAACTIALNPRGREEIVSFYGVDSARIRVLQLPTPSFALREGATAGAPRALEHLGVRGEYLFYPAQFWAHKNHACLLRALKLLAERHDFRPQLVLSGSDKGNRTHVERMMRELGLAEQVVFAGFVSREDLLALYRHAFALLFPSYFGPENLPPLEAMALGCPVIASNIPGHDLQLGAAAMLADPTRPEEWAEAVWRLRQDPAARAAQIERGRTRAAAYTADDYVTDLLKLADDLAAYRVNWP
jgi:glycosyltransferase involved in cell wall biosynthesis